MPVNLKSHSRIQAFLFIYFSALLVESIIEREIRPRMKAQKIASLPLYPERLPCKAPTANRIFDAFGDVRLHGLVGAASGSMHETFYDELTTTAHGAPPPWPVTGGVLLRGGRAARCISMMQ
jgi:hypothetical protein